MSRRADRPQPAAVERYLEGIRYPARKEDIIRCAEGNAAPGDLIDVLWDMPDREYADPIDLALGLGKIEHTSGHGQ